MLVKLLSLGRIRIRFQFSWVCNSAHKVREICARVHSPTRVHGPTVRGSRRQFGQGFLIGRADKWVPVNSQSMTVLPLSTQDGRSGSREIDHYVDHHHHTSLMDHHTSLYLQGVESTEETILAELGDTAHEELPAKGSQSQYSPGQ